MTVPCTGNLFPRSSRNEGFQFFGWCQSPADWIVPVAFGQYRSTITWLVLNRSVRGGPARFRRKVINAIRGQQEVVDV